MYRLPRGESQAPTPTPTTRNPNEMSRLSLAACQWQVTSRSLRAAGPWPRDPGTVQTIAQTTAQTIAQSLHCRPGIVQTWHSADWSWHEEQLWPG